MCHKVCTLSKNKDGQLTYCSTCDIYHLYFNNIYLEFKQSEMECFKKFITHINIEYWESSNDRVLQKRKIPIQTMQQNLAMVFNRRELYSLKAILFETNDKIDAPISLSEIDYVQYLN
ncbi:DUF6686 family protein [Maribacter antarcticus]|uniref:DUF6686 family protein n=1 Tax=Maribacter antarcticus TaxID=505250 RepID=UPI00047BD877|nr:DUF6686 family protein [Maribacter antarcticus]